MIYGYVRVSTKEQNEDRQMVALEEFRLKVDKVFMEKESGKNFERKEYQKLIKKLKKGDVVIIKSIDRLGRNYKEIIAEWRKITQDKKADIIEAYEKSGDIKNYTIEKKQMKEPDP